MKKNRIDMFLTPQRQSPYSLLFIAGESFRRLLNMAWPLLLVYFVGKSSSWFNYYLVAIAVLSALFSIAVGFLKYWNYTFYLERNKIIINKGIFKRSRISVPFDRIQIVRLDESVLHRWTHTQGLTIETAGSTTEELKIRALNHIDAVELRTILMPKKRSNSADTDSEHTEENYTEKLVIKHSFSDTLRVGLTQNHLKSAWYIAVFFLFLFSQLYEVIGDRIINSVMDNYESLFAVNMIVGSFLLIAIAVGSIIVSLTIAILQYFGLRVTYDGSHLRVKAGLFNRKEHTVKQERIQIYREESNPLRKIIDILSIDIHQPVSSSDMSKKSITISGVRSADIDTFRSFALQDTEFSTPIKIQSQPVVILRRVLYIAIIPILILALPGYYFFEWSSLLLLLSVPAVYGLSYIWFRKLHLEISEELIIRKGGLITTFSVFSDYSKIQNIAINQTPFQVRKALCNIVIYTAGGSISYPYISLNDGMKLRNYLLYRLETGSKEWM